MNTATVSADERKMLRVAGYAMVEALVYASAFLPHESNADRLNRLSRRACLAPRSKRNAETNETWMTYTAREPSARVSIGDDTKGL